MHAETVKPTQWVYTCRAECIVAILIHLGLIHFIFQMINVLQMRGGSHETVNQPVIHKQSIARSTKRKWK